MVFVALVSLTTVTAQAPDIERKPFPNDVKGMITYFAEEYGADEEELHVVAFCESGYKPHAVGDGGRARNIFQYHKPTFQRYAKLMGETLNYDSAYDQAKLTAWIFKNYPQEKDAWTCWTKNFVG